MMIDTDNYDWSKFEITYYYNAHITRVFKAWTHATGLESFLIQRCIYTDSDGKIRDVQESPKIGDAYEWQFRQGFNVKGEVLALIEKEQFSFSFGEMQVEVFFRVLDSQTEVSLVQSKIPATESGRVLGHLNSRSCWVFFMTNLLSVLGSGLDLRDDNVEIVSSMEVGFIPMTQR